MNDLREFFNAMKNDHFQKFIFEKFKFPLNFFLKVVKNENIHILNVFFLTENDKIELVNGAL